MQHLGCASQPRRCLNQSTRYAGSRIFGDLRHPPGPVTPPCQGGTTKAIGATCEVYCAQRVANGRCGACFGGEGYRSLFGTRPPRVAMFPIDSVSYLNPPQLQDSSF